MKIFLDTAHPDEIEAWGDKADGFTTNPSLMRAAGVTDYRGYCEALAKSTTKPVSLEVLADDQEEIFKQAEILQSFGENVWVKIPYLESRLLLLEALSELCQLNVTAMTVRAQVKSVGWLRGGPHIFSVFAGRIADAGSDPVTIMAACKKEMAPKHHLLWASAREIFNVRQAEAVGCEIITLGAALMGKLDGLGRDLRRVSLDTVAQFSRDGQGYSL